MTHDITKGDGVFKSSVRTIAAATAAATGQTLKTRTAVSNLRTMCTRHLQSVTIVEVRELEHVTIVPQTLRNEHRQIKLQGVVRAEQYIRRRTLQRRERQATIERIVACLVVD